MTSLVLAPRERPGWLADGEHPRRQRRGGEVAVGGRGPWSCSPWKGDFELCTLRTWAGGKPCAAVVAGRGSSAGVRP